jgi:hypothetical protein
MYMCKLNYSRPIASMFNHPSLALKIFTIHSAMWDMRTQCRIKFRFDYPGSFPSRIRYGFRIKQEPGGVFL